MHDRPVDAEDIEDLAGVFVHRHLGADLGAGDEVLVDEGVEALAGALLLTEDAALWIVRNGTSVPAAAQEFGISEQMVTYRLNVTGARARVARAQVSGRPVEA